eukprot:2922569-Prorocentrum_lima.AAC.1
MDVPAEVSPCSYGELPPGSRTAGPCSSRGRDCVGKYYGVVGEGIPPEACCDKAGSLERGSNDI